MSAPSATLQSTIRLAPNPFDADAAARLLDALPAAFFDSRPPAVRTLIEGVGGCSPFLTRLMSRSPDLLDEVLDAAPQASVDRAIGDAWRAAKEDDIGMQMRGLRLAKRRAALALALSEISGALDVMSATTELTRFADATVGAALRMALNDLRAKGFSPTDTDAPEKNCGVCAIAMGKMGAHELNYSSDIDLVVVYDSDSKALGDKDSAREIAVAATKAMVRRLSDQSADGYVFRTDLRLRPDPGVSAAAVSLNAAETYYEAYGQNWERAAYIKARAAAGDISVGEELIRRLQPFVWRKYLDFAAIDDILSVKRQIHAAKGGSDIDCNGHDIKTGIGGIREIEFSVQTQQLILGGRDQALRVRSTLDGLNLLRERGVVSEYDADALLDNYRYFRLVEHRIQMLDDEQTHKVPESDDGVARLASFLGESARATFESRLIASLTETHSVFSRLYKRDEAAEGDDAIDVLSFSGVEIDLKTEAGLKALGFSDPSRIAETFRRWQSGGVRATRTVRARDILAELTPTILKALSRASAPDEAFLAFEKFLGALPAGVQIFSLLAHKSAIFDILIRIVTIAPYLGKELARRRLLLEALTEANWPGPLKARLALETEIRDLLNECENFEEAMNILRRWNAEERFEGAAQLVIGAIDAATAATHFTTLAEVVINQLMPIARRETESRYGSIEGDIVVLALGRLGAGRMTAASDVDVMFIYDTPTDSTSVGEKPLDGVSYFTRLVRRFLTGMSTPTEEGVLYDVDMQLRPSGGAGPAAVSFDAFRKYYEKDAWTWEKMALVKARSLGQVTPLSQRVDKEIEHILGEPRDIVGLSADVEDMRQRLAASKPARDNWDLKRAKGGFTEIGFTIEYLTLRHAPAGFVSTPSLTASLSSLFRSGHLTENQFRTLSSADELFETIFQIGRASTGVGFSPDEAGAALADRVLEATLSPSLDALACRIREAQDAVLNVYYTTVTGEPDG